MLSCCGIWNFKKHAYPSVWFISASLITTINISARRCGILNPAFERTDQNNAEFARAGKASKLLRTAFRPQNALDSRSTGRPHHYGCSDKRRYGEHTRQRNVMDGEALLLQGFDFNIYGKLNTTVFAPYTASIDRVTGDVTVTIPSFIPNEMIVAPVDTTHFRFSLAAAEIDFENQVFNTLSLQSAFVVWNNQPSGELDLAVQLPAASTHPLFALLDIEFVQDVNNAKYSLKNGAFNACSIIKVNTPD